VCRPAPPERKALGLPCISSVQYYAPSQCPIGPRTPTPRAPAAHFLPKSELIPSQTAVQAEEGSPEPFLSTVSRRGFDEPGTVTLPRDPRVFHALADYSYLRFVPWKKLLFWVFRILVRVEKPFCEFCG
jgi:hypothetical protein